MSLLFFMVAMEYLSRVISMSISFAFKFHKSCKEVNLNHLYFADDLLLFSYGDVEYVSFLLILCNIWKMFLDCRLIRGKSLILFSNIEGIVKSQIWQLLKFREGILPVKYLGIPLVFTIVKKEYCQKLVDKIITTITCWTTKHLSYAGRVELVNFVVRSTYVYWYCALRKLTGDVLLFYG